MTDTAPQQKIKFYTTGYAGKDINDLKPLVNALDAVLIDVRSLQPAMQCAGGRFILKLSYAKNIIIFRISEVARSVKEKPKFKILTWA